MLRGSLRPVRNVWRSFAARWFGLDLPVSPVAALNGLSFTVTRGMVGILGPNGDVREILGKGRLFFEGRGEKYDLLDMASDIGGLL